MLFIAPVQQQLICVFCEANREGQASSTAYFPFMYFLLEDGRIDRPKRAVRRGIKWIYGINSVVLVSSDVASDVKRSGRTGFGGLMFHIYIYVCMFVCVFVFVCVCV